MDSYVLGALAAVALGAAAWGLYKDGQVRSLQLQEARVEGELLQCGARLANIIEDLRSDNEIDNLPDDALRVVPPHWLFPEADPPGD